MNQDEHIEREVKRRLATQLRTYNEEITSLQSKLKEQEIKLLQQQSIIKRTAESPLIFGTICSLNNVPDADYYCIGDTVQVISENHPRFNQTGTILSREEKIFVGFEDDQEEFFIEELSLLGKDDGTYAVVACDGKLWEVQGVADLGVEVGDAVRIFSNSHQIVGKIETPLISGPICIVDAVYNDSIEVLNKHEKTLVYNPRKIPLIEGDRVCVDSSYLVVQSKLEKDPRNKFKLQTESTISWDEIGGLKEVKRDIRDLLELPYKNKEIFDFYNKRLPQGILLYGPPGCGKTIVARAIARSLADIHKKESVASSFIFVKSPEILDKWVGSSESEIRNLFDRARKHHLEHGYPAVLAFDEADAIMPMRGTRRSSDVADTIVPMFLSEMDGLDSKLNPIVVLMTNRVDVLDPAIVRPGRISHHIRISRPDEDAAMSILDIHFKNCPFTGDKDQIIAIAVADIYSKSRVLYHVQNLPFTFGDIINGAMLASVVDESKSHAVQRDLQNKTMTGVDLHDLKFAINKIYENQKGLNHAYDLEDFVEANHLPKNAEITRSFGNS